MKNFVNPLDENFSYGYDDKIYNLRSDKNSVFQCHYTKATYLPRSFKEECINVCRRVSNYAKSVGRIPVILLSGGMDSEIVVRAFRDSGEPFKIVVNKFSNDLNSHEMSYVDKFLKSQNLTAEFVEFDIESWLRSDEALQMADDSKCPYSEMLPTMKLLSEVHNQGGIPVLGNGDFYSSRIEDQWMYVEYEYILSWMRYCVEKNIVGSINFFQQTSEIVLAMALDPMINQTVRENIEPNVRLTKYKIYQKYWNDAEIRPKFNGAEKIQNICDEINKAYLIKYSDYTSKWMKPLDEFLKELMPAS